MATIQIKNRYTGAVLFECEQTEGMTLRDALEKATTVETDLGGADLRGAYLGGAYLGGADLGGADLRGAYLGGADLRGAYLGGADLGDGKKLIGDRPCFQVGPIGSRSGYLQSFITDSGVVIKAGGFTGSIDEFLTAVGKEHGDNNHAKEYRAAITLIQKHAELWTPKVTA